MTDSCFDSLASTRGIREQGRTGGLDREGMNLVVIEEHQAEDLVFTQVYYLYILLRAISAHVNVPIAKVLRSKYSDCVKNPTTVFCCST